MSWVHPKKSPVQSIIIPTGPRDNGESKAPRGASHWSGASCWWPGRDLISGLAECQAHVCLFYCDVTANYSTPSSASLSTLTQTWDTINAGWRTTLSRWTTLPITDTKHRLEGTPPFQKYSNVRLYTHIYTHVHNSDSIKYSNPLALERIKVLRWSTEKKDINLKYEWSRRKLQIFANTYPL